ncbi:hypothetical protein BJX70DRAFT_240990 [Aspergillus crustosus]
MAALHNRAIRRGPNFYKSHRRPSQQERLIQWGERANPDLRFDVSVSPPADRNRAVHLRTIDLDPFQYVRPSRRKTSPWLFIQGGPGKLRVGITYEKIEALPRPKSRWVVVRERGLLKIHDALLYAEMEGSGRCYGLTRNATEKKPINDDSLSSLMPMTVSLSACATTSTTLLLHLSISLPRIPRAH